MGIESEVNISSDAAPYGGKSVFSQTEHNIVAGYLITAGKQEKRACSVWFLMQTYNTAYCGLKQISVIRDFFSEKKKTSNEVLFWVSSYHQTVFLLSYKVSSV